MTTIQVEKALEDLIHAKENYLNMPTFDSRLYWLRQLREEAINLKAVIDDTLGEKRK